MESVPTTPNWINSQLVIGLSRVASILGTALAGIGIWVFLGMWGDIREMNKSLNGLNTQVQVQGLQIVTIAQRNDIQDRRIERIESRVFP